VRVRAAWRDEIAAAMPELPDAKRKRFVREYGITPYDAGVLASSRELADYFEEVVRAGAPGKSAANWIQVELLRQLKDAGKEITESPLAPAQFAVLIAKVESGEINAASGKKVFARMFETGKPAAEIIAAEGFAQVSDTGEIERWAREVIEKNPDNVAKYRAGNEGVFKFFVGQVMRASRGQANPQAVNDTLKRLLS
jgi:aspartyl-tRNA(Asn)/glutamyl-tRNA(Gln) amidotransferase subunit B